jgi:hypothetical protein
VINSFGAAQDNVVFLGRRSFRMELAGRPGGNDLGIPKSASEIPTEKIFDADRERAVRAAVASLRPAGKISNVTSIALCLTTFALGIAVTLTFYRAEPRRPLAFAPIAPAQIAPTPPAPPLLIQPISPPPAEVAALSLTPTIRPARRPLAKPAARVARPRPVRAVQVQSAAAAQSDAPTAKPWVDPFAE